MNGKDLYNWCKPLWLALSIPTFTLYILCLTYALIWKESNMVTKKSKSWWGKKCAILIGSIYLMFCWLWVYPFALSGGISIYSLQQGLLLNTQYASSFLAIFAFGILVIFPGVAIFIFANKKKSSINLPPPPDFLEVPPPPWSDVALFSARQTN